MKLYFRGTASLPGGSVNQGLWRGCSTVPGAAFCLDTVSSCPSELPPSLVAICHKMIAAKAFMTLACLLSAFSALCIFSNLTNNTNSNSMMIMICRLLPVLCFVCGIIGVGLGIAYITDQELLKISTAAILGIAAVVLNLIGAVLTVLIR